MGKRLGYISFITNCVTICCINCLLCFNYAFAQDITPIQIERSQEIIQEDKALRQRIEQEEKFFVRTIVLKGTLKLPEEEIKDIVPPFQGQWMTKEDIQQIIDALKSAYEKKGIKSSRINASYELKKDKTLEITINELT